MVNQTNFQPTPLVRQTIDNLRRNGFQSEYFADRHEAVNYILSLIPAQASIGFGGSMTVTELKIQEMLATDNHRLLNHAEARSKEESLEICRAQLTADVFIASANALSADGKIVNIDGRSNRVAALSFGPGKAILVCGTNKITTDLEAALWRASNVAAPKNAKRLNKKTPCAVTEKCHDCSSPERICCTFNILHRKPQALEFHVIIIDEQLGY